jgi:hypothetical protein
MSPTPVTKGESRWITLKPYQPIVGFLIWLRVWVLWRAFSTRKKGGQEYLPNWIDNIDHEFKGLSPEVSSEIQCDYLLTLLRKGRDLLQKAYGDQDPNTAKIAVLISRILQ